MKKKEPSAENGYTLIEVLLYTVILGLFLLLTTQLFIAVKMANANSQSLVDLQRNLRQVTSDLTQTIRNADTVLTPLPGNSSEILSLNDGAVIYQITDGVFEKVLAGQAWAVTTDEVQVSNLLFENMVEATQTATIKISLEVEAKIVLEGGRRLSETLSTSVGLR